MYLLQGGKIKVNVPNFLVEILDKDIEHFNLSKNGLYNLIFLKYALKFRSNYSEEFGFDDKKYIQIQLNKENRKLFRDITKDQIQLSNSEIMREILLAYAVMPSFIRESILYREKIAFIKNSQKEYRVLKIRTPEGIVEDRIEKLFRDEKDNYFRIRVAKKDYYISQCEVIS